MTRILATGDWHIGAGSQYGRRPGDRLADQAAVADLIAELAIEREVDLVIHCGDVLDGPTVFPEHLAVFADFVNRLRAASIPIIVTRGNGKHDQSLRDVDGLAIFNSIPGCTVSSRPEILNVAGVAIATLPWVSPGLLVAARDGGESRDEINREIAGLLVRVARGLRDQIPTDQPAILALHWSVSGASTPDGALTDLFAEPVIDAYALQELGFDAVVMGHIHAPQHFLRDGSACRIIFHDHPGQPTTVNEPMMFYVGSPMPLSFGETACAHGVWLLDVGASTAEFLPIESRPFVTIDVDCTEYVEESAQACLVGAIDNDADSAHEAVVRLRYRATSEQQRRIDLAAIRARLTEYGAHCVKTVPDIVREDRARIQGVTAGIRPLDALDLYVKENGIEAGLAERMRERTARYLENVTP